MFSDDEKIRKIQENLLLLLQNFDKICKDNDLKYSLHGGTLLGAIREKGFIPWDDDIDITMERKYFDRFISLMEGQGKSFDGDGCSCCGDKSVCNKESSEGGEAFCGEQASGGQSVDGKQPVSGKHPVGEKHPVGGAKIVTVRSVPRFMVPSVSEELWMDIFVYDSISNSRIGQKIKVLRLLAVDAFTRSRAELNNMAGDMHKKWEVLAFKFVNLCGRMFTKKYRSRLHDKVARGFFAGDGSHIHRSNDQKAGVGVILNKEWMKDYIYVPFENYEFMVTKNYHEVLVTAYGENYMTPIKDEKQGAHHEKMRKFLKDEGAN